MFIGAIFLRLLLFPFPQVDGRVVLRFAYAYGFRNIQSILAKARRGKCPYQFVEVMACPSGCVNGGGQIKPSKKERADDTRKRVEKVCVYACVYLCQGEGEGGVLITTQAVADRPVSFSKTIPGSILGHIQRQHINYSGVM